MHDVLDSLIPFLDSFVQTIDIGFVLTGGSDRSDRRGDSSEGKGGKSLRADCVPIRFVIIIGKCLGKLGHAGFSQHIPRGFHAAFDNIRKDVVLNTPCPHQIKACLSDAARKSGADSGAGSGASLKHGCLLGIIGGVLRISVSSIFGRCAAADRERTGSDRKNGARGSSQSKLAQHRSNIHGGLSNSTETVFCAVKAILRRQGCFVRNLVQRFSGFFVGTNRVSINAKLALPFGDFLFQFFPVLV
ncbi:MAG: hypothetical protein MRZ31_02035 [Dysosmobacter sp.]|uniref:hypothetical protein n=1 Tax=Dysosmobacter sp. TaxID=2591382 RepID=UPI002673911A|nr:hypothetical protein [Dysosmobacter sp.]MCI6015460.1 hypothetical protein [Dysosmobacter sp.]